MIYNAKPATRELARTGRLRVHFTSGDPTHYKPEDYALCGRYPAALTGETTNDPTLVNCAACRRRMESLARSMGALANALGFTRCHAQC